MAPPWRQTTSGAPRVPHSDVQPHPVCLRTGRQMGGLRIAPVDSLLLPRRLSAAIRSRPSVAVSTLHGTRRQMADLPTALRMQCRSCERSLAHDQSSPAVRPRQRRSPKPRQRCSHSSTGVTWPAPARRWAGTLRGCSTKTRQTSRCRSRSARCHRARIALESFQVPTDAMPSASTSNSVRG